MDILQAQNQIKQLVLALNHFTKLYDLGIPSISDAEWDKLYFELVELERQFPSLIQEDSPTQKINYAVVNELKKVKHEYQPMLSLAKTKDIEEIKSFIGNKDWIAMLKMDGLTCRLTYEEGKLVRAETRGNGIEGEDITHNAMVLPSIPKRIPYTDTLIVDGEVICDLKTFEGFKNEYSNARNFAAGSIRLLDSKECTKRGLTFVAWDIISGVDTETMYNKLMFLIDFNFINVPFIMGNLIDNNIERSLKLRQLAEEYNYPIDGIVFKWDNCAEYEAAGRTDHHFRGGMAFKFYDEEYETELLDIEWTMGRTGVLTPVAIYKDVNIDGAICNRASLHNINTMNELLGNHPYIGQKIWIYRSNMIIPQISKSLPPPKGVDVLWIHIPDICPICGGEAEIHENISGTVELLCMNPDCDGKLINRIDHFAGKKGLDIKGLSKATLEKLIDWGWVTNAKDLFFLHQHEREWIAKPGFGEKSVKKILDAIEAARHCTLEAYICALGIPLIGKTYARELAKEFGDYETFKSKLENGFNFMKLEGFGPEKHDAIVSFDYADADMMVHRNIIDFVEEAALENSGNSLEGTIFCVTGKLKNFKNRDELKALIEQHGGKVTGSVSAKTNYLINNDATSGSAKNVSAKSLGVKIITEAEFLDMIK